MVPQNRIRSHYFTSSFRICYLRQAKQDNVSLTKTLLPNQGWLSHTGVHLHATRWNWIQMTFSWSGGVCGKISSVWFLLRQSKLQMPLCADASNSHRTWGGVFWTCNQSKIPTIWVFWSQPARFLQPEYRCDVAFSFSRVGLSDCGGNNRAHSFKTIVDLEHRDTWTEFDKESQKVNVVGLVCFFSWQDCAPVVRIRMFSEFSRKCRHGRTLYQVGHYQIMPHENFFEDSPHSNLCKEHLSISTWRCLWQSVLKHWPVFTPQCSGWTCPVLVSSPSLAVDFVAVKRVVEAITSTPIPETIFCAVLPEWFLLSFTWVSLQRKADSS